MFQYVIIIDGMENAQMSEKSMLQFLINQTFKLCFDQYSMLIYSSSPLSAVLLKLSKVSVTQGQLRPKNIKWKFTEINNS